MFCMATSLNFCIWICIIYLLASQCNCMYGYIYKSYSWLLASFVKYRNLEIHTVSIQQSHVCSMRYLTFICFILSSKLVIKTGQIKLLLSLPTSSAVKCYLCRILNDQIPWRSGEAAALWQWGHGLIGFKSWKQPLAEMQEKTAYIRPKVVGPFPGPCASGSYVHRATLYWMIKLSYSFLITHISPCFLDTLKCDGSTQLALEEKVIW
jgi:hypothetical protein